MHWPTRRSIVPTAAPAVVTGVVAAVLALTLAGCGSDPASTGQAAATPTAAAQTATSDPRAAAGTPGQATPATAASVPPAKPAQPAGTTITVRVTEGQVTPKAGRVSVALGTKVRLVVTSDVADEVHVHSYDRELRLTPGKPAVLEFTADKPGLFEVETHETQLILFQLLVR